MSTVSNLQFSNSGNGTITVTFTAPSSGTWSTSSFFYNITGSSSSFFNTFSSTTSLGGLNYSMTINGIPTSGGIPLSNGTPYPVKIATSGTGANQTPSPVSCVPGGRPTITSITCASGNKITVNFSPVFGTVNSYQYSTEGTGTNFGNRTDGSGSLTSMTISTLANTSTSLSPNFSYPIRIRAFYGSSNFGIASEPVNAIPISNITFNSLTSTPEGQLSVSYTGGTGAATFNYTTNDGNIWRDLSNNLITTDSSGNALVPGNSYTVKLRGVNSLSQTGAATSGLSTLVTAKPATPNAPTVTAGNGLVDLSWNIPSNNGSAITSYKVQYSSNGGSSWSSDISVNINSTSISSGLTVGSSYIFKVAAVNAAGTSAYSSNSVRATVKNSGGNFNSVNVSTLGSSDIGKFYTNNGETFIYTEVNDTNSTFSTNISDAISLSNIVTGVNYILAKRNFIDASDNSTTTALTKLYYGEINSSSLSLSFGDENSSTYNYSLVTADTSANNYVLMGSNILTSADTDSNIISSFYIKTLDIQTGNLKSTSLNYTINLTNNMSAMSLSTPKICKKNISSGIWEVQNDINVSVTGNTLSFHLENNSEYGIQNNPPPTTVPDDPTLTVANPYNTSIELNWTAPVNNGGINIDSYTIHYLNDSSGVAVINMPADLSYNITGLTNGETYTYYVTAHNSIGDSAPSNNISAIPYTVPGQPNITNTSTGNQMITISFAPGFNGGRDISGYQYSIDSNATWNYVSLNNSGQIEITGLNNGQSYTGGIRAYNVAGFSAPDIFTNLTPSDIIIVTPAVPDAPTTNSIAAGSSDGEIDVSWIAPNNNGSQILDYTLSYRILDQSSSPFTDISVNGDLIEYTITGLDISSYYVTKVRARNSVGLGNYSSEYAATMPRQPGGGGDPHIKPIIGDEYDLPHNENCYLLYDNQNDQERVIITAKCWFLPEKLKSNSLFRNAFMESTTFFKYINFYYNGENITFDMETLKQVKYTNMNAVKNHSLENNINKSNNIFTSEILEDKLALKKFYSNIKRYRYKIQFNGKSRIVKLGNKYEFKLSMDLNCADHRNEITFIKAKYENAIGAFISEKSMKVIDYLIPKNN
jgi:hypothetical protein